MIQILKYHETILIFYVEYKNIFDHLLIKYNDTIYHFHRVEFIKSFKFYRSPKDVQKFIAIRWYNPWEYIAMVEFQGFEIKRILNGENQKEKDEINHYYWEEILAENWSEFNFETFFPTYKHSEIINKIRSEILY